MAKGNVKCISIDYERLDSLGVKPCFTLGNIYKCELCNRPEDRMDITDDKCHVWKKKKIDGQVYKFQIV